MTIESLGRSPMELWDRVASAMGQAPDDKTIVFAIKIFDLMHKTRTGVYAFFPSAVPIVVDLRIARISISSGLVLAADGQTVLQAITNASEIAAKEKDTLIAAWADVARSAGNISLFRIDSLAWQVAEPIYQHRLDRRRAAEEVTSRIAAYGLDTALAARIASGLTSSL